MTFLEVVTRHAPSRVEKLARCVASLEPVMATGRAKHTVLVDPAGPGARRSLLRANSMLARHEPGGEWVWILDDDDEHVDCDLVWVLGDQKPGILVVMMMGDFSNHGVGIIPRRGWGRNPKLGDVGMSCFAVAGSVYREFRDKFAVPLAADHSFASHVLEVLPDESVAWVPVVVARDCERDGDNE